jgi:hypothetical protein
VQSARKQGALGAVYVTAAHVREATHPPAPEGAPPPTAMDLGLAVAAHLGT